MILKTLATVGALVLTSIAAGYYPLYSMWIWIACGGLVVYMWVSGK